MSSRPESKPARLFPFVDCLNIFRGEKMKKLAIGLAVAIFLGVLGAAPAKAEEPDCISKLRSLASSVRTLDGGTEFDFTTPSGLLSYDVVNQNFSPLDATSNQLLIFGFPERPTDEASLSQWVDVVNKELEFDINDNGCSILDSLRTSDVEQYASHNANAWSGYVALPSTSVQAVQGSFVIPPFNSASCPGGTLAIWVGIGGTGSKPLVQAGWTYDSTGHAFPFWEIVTPGGSTPITSFGVPANSGDLVTAKVQVITATSDVYFQFIDSATGSNKTVKVTPQVPLSAFYDPTSADFITERLFVNGASSQLTRFSTFAWSGANVTSSMGTIPLGLQNPQQWFMVNSATGSSVAKPSSVVSDIGFNQTWLACQ